MKIKRIYVYQELVEDVEVWALDQWKRFGARAKNGKPLHKNFPDSLEQYMGRCEKNGIRPR
jgi:hypothetical protein